jgi:hypothetical protein
MNAARGEEGAAGPSELSGGECLWVPVFGLAAKTGMTLERMS